MRVADAWVVQARMPCCSISTSSARKASGGISSPGLVTQDALPDLRYRRLL